MSKHDSSRPAPTQLHKDLDKKLLDIQKRMQAEQASKPATPSIVQELCQKLAVQLEQLGHEIEVTPPSEETADRKEMFRALKEQLAALSR